MVAAVSIQERNPTQIADPIKFTKFFWPDIQLYDKQKDLMYSVVDNDETYVPSANMMGKDFVAGLIVLHFFITRHPCRIVTTSAGEDHLSVLWGEIGRFIQTAKYPIDAKFGGCVICNHRELRKVYDGVECKISYVKGMVAGTDNLGKMQGHHANPMNVKDANDGIPRSLFVSDESQSVVDEYYTMACTWAKRMLLFGNTWQCVNYYRRGIDGGDMVDSNDPQRFFRKVVRIKGEDSPNVILGLLQERQGKVPTNEVLVPGLLTYREYKKRRATLDAIKQCVILDAIFYKGKEVMLYPETWLNRAETLARMLQGKPRKAKAIGCDSAQGGDNTSWSIVDHLGLIEQISLKTPDTTYIPNRTIALIQQYGVPPENVMFDAGGGGYQHVDRLREQGYPVVSVAFGEQPTDPDKFQRRMRTMRERKEEAEIKQVFKNRRAEMYGILRMLLEPPGEYSLDKTVGFAIGAEFTDLRKQLDPIPLWYNEEGQLYLPPKNRRPDVAAKGAQKLTMTDLVGRSPDEADSLALAVYGLFNETDTGEAGAVW